MARSDVVEPREDAAARARPGREAESREPQPPRGRTEERQQDQGRSEQPSPEDQAKAKRKKRRWLLIGAAVALVVLVGGGWYGWHWWTVGRYMVSTDDAYTEADSVTVSPQVAGYVAELRVTDNQEVRRGDVLLRIDDSTYRARVDQADAQLAAAKANVDNVGAQIERQQAAIAQAQADLDAARAQLTYAQEQSSRYGQLAKSGAGTVQQQQQASSGLEQARAGVGKGEANLQAAQKDLGVLQTQKEQAQAAVRQAEAALDQARIDLGHTVVAAPIDGVVGDRAVQTGALVQPGTKLMTLVPLQDVYVVANFKETQLQRMHRGQPVDLTVDAYPGVTIKGHLDSLAPGSGAEFALLPPENATGNFTKIVQRVPVKILLEKDQDPLLGRLRPGLSVVPTVDTLDTKGEPLERRPPQAGLPPPSTGGSPAGGPIAGPAPAAGKP